MTVAGRGLRVHVGGAAELSGEVVSDAGGRRLARVRNLVRQVLGAPEAVEVVVMADGDRQPCLTLRLPARRPTGDELDGAALELAQQVAEAIEDDASMSRATLYKVLVQDEDGGTLTHIGLRVGRDGHRGGLDAQLRQPSETEAAAVLRQLMRHHEVTARMYQEGMERSTMMVDRFLGRIESRLQRLEETRETVEQKSVERMRLEAELARELGQHDRRARMEGEAFAMLRPLMPIFAAKVAAAVGGGKPEAPARAPRDTSSSTRPASSRDASGPAAPADPWAEVARAAAAAGESAATGDSDDAAVVAAIQRLDPATVEALSAFLAGEGMTESAAAVRRIATRKD